MGTESCRCRYCGLFFMPDPRTARIQKRCARPECRRAGERERYRRWVTLNGGRKDRKPKMRAWAQGCSYWERYRKGHPEYVKKDNARRRKAYRKAIFSAKQTSRAVVAREKLGTLAAEIRVVLSAKPTPMLPVITGIVEYLVWDALAAKPMPIGMAGGADA